LQDFASRKLIRICPLLNNRHKYTFSCINIHQTIFFRFLSVWTILKM